MNLSPLPGNKPHILVLAGVHPCASNPDEAANVITHELIRYLVASGNFEVAFAAVQVKARPPSFDAASDMKKLEALGARILDTVVLKEPSDTNPVSRFFRFLRGDPRLIRGFDTGAAFAPQLRAFPTDVILTVWSELATAATARIPVRKVAYYGNPDHKVLAARRKLSRKAGIRKLLPIDRLIVSGVERAHLKIMATQDAIGDVAKNDAEYYLSKGLKQAFYVPNMWIPPEASYDEIRKEEVAEPIKIIGNVGGLGATGNTFGLATIGRDLVPALKQELGPGNFEIHLFGSGSPDPSIAHLLDDPCIVVRGFVPDLEAEMRSAPIFLVANNSSEFVVGHTRFLHAWSQGCCVVAFEESRLAMPEIEHDRNSLLGGSPEEVVRHIVECARNVDLRRRLGRQGFEDLRSRFAPETAGGIMASTITRLVSGSRLGSSLAA